MASVGTYIIAFFGYGLTALCGLGTLVSLKDYVRAQRSEDRRAEILNVFVGAILTIFLAVITRGLVGAL